MEKMKEALAKVAPWIISWAMGLGDILHGRKYRKGLFSLISIVEVFNDGLVKKFIVFLFVDLPCFLWWIYSGKKIPHRRKN